MRFTEHDETRVKNQYATFEEIDDRQSLELLLLLEKWEKGQVEAGEVVTQISHLLDAHTMMDWDYNKSRENGPGTKSFEKQLAGIKPALIKKKEELAQHCLIISGSQIEWVERLYNPEGPVKDENRRKLLVEQKEKALQLQAKANHEGKPLIIPTAGALITGPPRYVDAMNQLIAKRDECVRLNQELGVVALENKMMDIIIYRRECEHDVDNIDAAYEREKAALIYKYKCMRESLTSKMHPEVAADDIRTLYVTEGIRKIIGRLENAECNSWEAATEAVRFIFNLPEEEKKVKKDIKIDDNTDLDDLLEDLEEDFLPLRDHSNDSKDTRQIREFLQHVASAQKEAEALKKDINETLDLFSPETEDSIKEPIGREWARDRAWAAWEEIKRAEAKAEDPDAEEERYVSSWGFEEFFEEKYLKDDKADFIPPIEFPDRKLCNEMHIVPSGTGLIQIHENHKGYIYGNDVARITTYSVSFVPKTPEDKELLCELLYKAMRVLGDIPYKYQLPGWTPSGEPYKRPKGSDGNHGDYDHTYTGYIKTEDGRVTPDAHFDLDDLWILYYIMEPVIEPSAQIANAMNMALYAEERGALLVPDEFDYVHDGHKVAEESGYMKDVDPEDLLPKLMRDAFIDLALNKTDEAGFIINLTTLADHTLTGKLLDTYGTLKTYNNMIDDQRARGTNVSTYNEALTDRTKELLATLLNLPADSNADLGEALKRMLHQTAPSLKAHFRSKTRTDTIELYAALDRHREQQRATMDERWDQMLEDAATSEDKFAMLNRLTDAFAGRAGITDEEREKIKETALTAQSNLVVADSAVETCMDGIHAGGRYRSKTKGSPYVRKEMPATLKPFVTNPDNRPAHATLVAPINIIK